MSENDKTFEQTLHDAGLTKEQGLKLLDSLRELKLLRRHLDECEENLAQAKADEKALRLSIVESLFPACDLKTLRGVCALFEVDLLSQAMFGIRRGPLIDLIVSMNILPVDLR